MTQKQVIPYFLAVAISLPLMAIDLHLPSLPIMANYFNVSDAVIKNSISTFQFGLLASALFYGPLSDSFGRRPIMLFGAGLFMVCSSLLVFSTQIDDFLFLRFLQGCGGGVAAALVPAILGDKFSESEGSKVIAQMAIFILMTPAIAPIVGGYLTYYFGWQSCFIFLSISSTTAFLVFLIYFPETHFLEARIKLKITELFKKYKEVLSNKRFLAYALVHGFPSSATWCVITISPFILVKHMGVEIQHLGYYITTMVLIVSGASYYVQSVVTARGPEWILSTGIKLLLIGGIASVLGALIFPSSPIIALLCILPCPMGVQFTFPVSVTKSISSITDIKGTGSAVLTTIRQLFAVIGSLVATLLSDTSFLETGLFMVLVALCTIAALYYANKFATKLNKLGS